MAFTAHELEAGFDLPFALEWGTLPAVHMDRANARELLDSYVHTYLKEEIREEGLVRSIAPFVRFLAIAGQLNGQVLNGQNVAREAAVPRSTVDGYFQILEDTLLGHFLPAYRPNVKVREQAHRKFFWLDPGVARAAAGLLLDPVDRSWKGFALETLVFHELRVHGQTAASPRPIHYYASGSGNEIDFVIETRRRQGASAAHVVLVEVKLAETWNRRWEAPMRSFAAHGGVAVDRMFGVYTGQRAYHFDGVDVLPLPEFLAQLAAGGVI